MPRYLSAVKSYLSALPQYVVPTVVSLVTFGLIARVLTANELGVYGLIVSATYLIGLTSNFGIKKAVIVRISKGENIGVFWGGMIYSTLISILFALLTITLLKFFKIFESVNLPEITYHLYFILLLIFSYRNYFTAGLESLKKFHIISLYTSIGFIVYRILMLTLVVYGYSVYGVIIAWIIGESISVIPLINATLNFFKGFNPILRGKEIFDILKEAPSIYFSDLTLVLIDYGDRILTGIFGLYFLANFYIASTGAQSLSSLAQALYSGLLPHIAEEYGVGGRKSLQEYLEQLSKFFFLFLSPMYLVSAVLAYPLMFIFVGPSYNVAVSLFQIIVLGLWLTSITPLITTSLIATGKSKEAMISQLVGLGVDIAILLGLYTYIGFLSAGFGKAFLYIASLAIGIYFLKRKIGVAPYHLNDILKILLANILLGVSTWFLWVYTFRISLLPLYIIFSIVIYLLYLRILKVITKRDIEILEEELPLKGKIKNIIIKLVSKVTGVT